MVGPISAVHRLIHAQAMVFLFAIVRVKKLNASILGTGMIARAGLCNSDMEVVILKSQISFICYTLNNTTCNM